MIHQKISYHRSVLGSVLFWVLIHRMEYTEVVPKVSDIGICSLVTEKLEAQLQRPFKREAVKLSLFRALFPIARFCNILAFV